MQPEIYILTSSLSSAVLYGIIVRASPSYSRMACKTLGVSLLALFVAMLQGPKYLSGALAFGALGDAFLAWDSETAFLGGLGSFLVSHLIYIALFIENGTRQLALADLSRTAIAISAMVLGPTMLMLLIPRVSSELRFPVSLYTCAILGMVFSALTIENDRVILGAILFTVSDTILALGKFLVPPSSSHHVWMDGAVWTFYYSGQLMITLGTLEHVGIHWAGN